MEREEREVSEVSRLWEHWLGVGQAGVCTHLPQASRQLFCEGERVSRLVARRDEEGGREGRTREHAGVACGGLVCGLRGEGLG